jgi:hypothetical protein
MKPLSLRYFNPPRNLDFHGETYFKTDSSCQAERSAWSDFSEATKSCAALRMTVSNPRPFQPPAGGPIDFKANFIIISPIHFSANQLMR